MELLIPGLILVALMVYASTKIKKIAARAYEPETFETEQFSIEKPDGFIIPVADNEAQEFRAYTKEFGTDTAERLRQATAKISIYGDTTFEEARDRAKHSVRKVVSEKASYLGDAHVCELETASEKEGVPLKVYFKICQGREKIFELRISVLEELKDEYLRKTESMLASFELK